MILALRSLPCSVVRPLLFFCFSLNRWPHARVWTKQKKRSRAQCIGWIHRNSRKRDRKKNTLSSERNWYLEVRPDGHLLSWPSGLRQQAHLREVSPCASSNPVWRTLFFFFAELFAVYVKVLGILLRFS